MCCLSGDSAPWRHRHHRRARHRTLPEAHAGARRSLRRRGLARGTLRRRTCLSGKVNPRWPGPPWRGSALFLLILLVAGCGTGEGPGDLRQKPLPVVAPGALGPFAVGRTDRIVTPRRDGIDREGFTVTVWYPADTTPRPARTPFSGLFGASVKDAPVLEGVQPFPLVLFAHGLRAIREQNSYQVEWLASRGYVVVSGDFHG
ncbi:MAG: alpha/beta hydrolase, partial [Candidatus Dadabacteria bacterium]